MQEQEKQRAILLIKQLYFLSGASDDCTADIKIVSPYRGNAMKFYQDEKFFAEVFYRWFPKIDLTRLVKSMEKSNPNLNFSYYNRKGYEYGQVLYRHPGRSYNEENRQLIFKTKEAFDEFIKGVEILVDDRRKAFVDSYLVKPLVESFLLRKNTI